jgi:hypothetical protein
MSAVRLNSAPNRSNQMTGWVSEMPIQAGWRRSALI